MRIYQLFHALIEKFVPMDKSTQDDLQLEAVKYYNKAVEDKVYVELWNQEAIAKNASNAGVEGYVPVPLRAISIKSKAISFLDQWYIRYAIALVFIYMVPAIKNYMAGDSPGDEDEEDSEESDFKKFEDYQRFKKSML